MAPQTCALSPTAAAQAGGAAVHAGEMFAVACDMLFEAARQHSGTATNGLEIPLWSGLRLQALPVMPGRSASSRVPADSRPAPMQSLKDVETALIRQAVTEARGNVMEAARQLGISRATVYRRLGAREH
ncbi:MAG: signal transduction protein : sensor, domain [Polaromonas sp.]|nr:signal transduction protein : sensor, domain [Polaromonas sp.]